jgi:hypothetical protein
MARTAAGDAAYDDRMESVLRPAFPTFCSLTCSTAAGTPDLSIVPQ